MAERFDSEWLAAREMRQRVKEGKPAVEGCDKESELHEQIFAECRRRGWIALHGAMSERTHRTAGEPDFVILANADDHLPSYLARPRVFFVECKTRTGKLSPEQSAMIHHVAKLGHAIHVVRSFEEFLKLL